MEAASGGYKDPIYYLFTVHEIYAVVKVDGRAAMSGDQQNLVSILELL